MEEWEAVIRRAGEPGRDFNVYTEEALAAQDGKVVPLTLEPGGPVIGEATMKYDSTDKALMAQFRVDDPNVARVLEGLPLGIIE